MDILQGSCAPGNPGKLGKVREFENGQGKPGKVREFKIWSGNFLLSSFFILFFKKSLQKCQNTSTLEPCALLRFNVLILTFMKQLV